MGLIVRALLGVARFDDAAPADPWKELEALAADPASGIALRGRPPAR